MSAELHALGAEDSLNLLTVDELADLLKISKTGVYRLVERRDMPFYKVGGVLRFDRRDLQEYLRHHRVASTREHATGI